MNSPRGYDARGTLASSKKIRGKPFESKFSACLACPLTITERKLPTVIADQFLISWRSVTGLHLTVKHKNYRPSFDIPSWSIEIIVYVSTPCGFVGLKYWDGRFISRGMHRVEWIMKMRILKRGSVSRGVDLEMIWEWKVLEKVLFLWGIQYRSSLGV